MGEGEGQSGRIIGFLVWASSRLTDTAQISSVRTAACYLVMFRNFPFGYSRIKVSLCCTLLLGFKKTDAMCQ